MDPRNGGDLLCSQEGVYPVSRRGRLEGGAGYGCCPIGVGRGDPQDLFRVPAGRNDEEEQRGARALLPEDVSPVVGTPGSGEGGGQVWVGPATGRVRRRRENGAPAGLPGNASHTMAYEGVGLLPSYAGLVGRRRAGASSMPSTDTVISPTSRSSSGGCRRWSAASSLDTPPGYVARAWFRYGAVSPVKRVLRACSRAGALLRRDMADDRSRQPQGVPHGQGPDRPVRLVPLHPVPVEGRLWADEPRLDGVHDPVHRRVQRRGPCSIQGADCRVGGLVEESPRTARQVTLCGSVCLVRLRHRVRH